MYFWYGLAAGILREDDQRLFSAVPNFKVITSSTESFPADTPEIFPLPTLVDAVIMVVSPLLFHHKKSI